ncbi:hypothetical protein [Clostridium oceanicum]|uniref:Uncharacterized protein n=1 Tax=Clostridium oceanicum TaxID=1543 RepID=A0ABN1JAQ7_9CLOT
MKKIKLSFDTCENTKNFCNSLLASGSFSSRGQILDTLVSNYIKNDYQITVNGTCAPISKFLISTPYMRKDFYNLSISNCSVISKKFIYNLNNIPNPNLKTDVFEFIAACTKFITSIYGQYCKCGCVENISIYYPNNSSNKTLQDSDYFHAVYILVKNRNSSVKISRYMQLKLKNRSVGPKNILWDEIQNFLLVKYKLPKDDIYTLDCKQLEFLNSNL